jgi:HIRAN domain-containing protein
VTTRLRLWLERGELEGGEGYWLRDASSGEALRWDDDRLAEAGARVVRLAGSSYRQEALQDPAFAPGSELELVPEPENEHDPRAVGIWDAALRLQAGYVPAETARELVLPLQAISLWEWREQGRRVGLRVLLAPLEAWIGRPRQSG